MQAALQVFLGYLLCVLVGAGKNRVQAFLLRGLKQCTQERYAQAIARFNGELVNRQADWHSFDIEAKDWWLAEFLLDEFEAQHGKAEAGILLSALQKCDPRSSFKVSWKVFDVWSRLEPAKQAPNAPSDLVWAMVVCAFLLQRPALGMVFCLCYNG